MAENTSGGRGRGRLGEMLGKMLEYYQQNLSRTSWTKIYGNEHLHSLTRHMMMITMMVMLFFILHETKMY